MKKIVSAALVASMVAGAAFAVDAKITLNYRTKLDAFAYTSAKAGDNKTITKEWLDWEGYDGAGKQAATNASDSLKFVLNGDRAGATFAVNINENNKDTSNQSKEYKQNEGQLFTLNEYSAWMNWELGPGVLKVGSGNWKDGFADGAYRVKKDVDAQNAEGMDFERFKLGSILKGSSKLSFVDDLAAGANNTALFSYADYGFQAGDAAKVNVLLGSVYNKFDTVVDDDTTTYYDAFFVSRAQVAMDVLNAELIFKKPAPHVIDFAAYVMPKVLDGLTLNIGGAIENDNRDKDAGGYTDWAFDLRARYQATSELSVTFFTNISGTNLDAGRNLSSGIAGHKGAEGLAGKIDGTNQPKFKTAMWNNLSARYKINDTLAATLNFGLVTPLSKADGDDNSYSPEWRVTPAIQVYAGSNASIWAGLALSGASAKVNDTDYSVFALQIPVIFRVKM
ncbi:hypothetical protein [Treponema sp.]|uniref:hypothetical protein n=1 Tax=Treponema sp. TaxID=166 RepID=UPI0025FA2C8A|nr:hypothetical protein [Treponema sp.]MBR4321548.1 hypothetical protein [Treponema sp.]